MICVCSVVYTQLKNTVWNISVVTGWDAPMATPTVIGQVEPFQLGTKDWESTPKAGAVLMGLPSVLNPASNKGGGM